MLATLIEASIRLRGAVVGLCLVLFFYGGWRLSQAGLDIFPEFAPKQVVVQTEAPGLPAEQVERRITQTIENSLGGLAGLTDLRSESIAGLSVVTAIFAEDIGLQDARQRIGERLAALAPGLPAGTGPPLAVPLSSSSATILTLGLTGKDLLRLRDFADWTLVPRLLAIPGVADVNVFGGGRRQLQIRLDPEKLFRHRLGINTALEKIEGALQRHGMGYLSTLNQRLDLILGGGRFPLERIRRLPLSPALTLDRVAEVGWGQAPPFSAAQVGGDRGLVLMVIGQYGANTLTVSRAVEKVLEDFRPLLATQGISLHPRLFRPADYIERSLRSLGGHLLLGAGLVLIVLYGFLGDWRSALICTLAIPLSLLATALVLMESGIHLNIMVLGGLAIALGEVVDDAIIDTENIFRRLRENRLRPTPRPPAEIVLRASLEVRGSVVYASFIVALVFVPLLTLGGVAGRLFAPLGSAYILAILASLAVALTVTPALGYLLLARRGRYAEPLFPQRLQHRYTRLLVWILRHPKPVWGGALVLCLAAFGSLPALGGRFLPELREGHFIVHTASLPGTALPASLRLGERLTRSFLEIPGVVSVSQWAGRAERGADTYGSHYSEYEVHLEPSGGKRQQAVLERIREVLDRFPGIAFEANTFLTERIDETLTGYTAPVVVNLYGPETGTLDRLAREVAGLMRSLPGARDVRIRSQTVLPQLSVEPDFEAMALWGVTPGTLSGILHTGYAGQRVGESYHGNRVFPVTVLLPEKLRADLSTLPRLPVETPAGDLLRLKDLVRVRLGEGRYNYLHHSAQRLQVVTANPSGDLAGFTERLRKQVLSHIRFPPGYAPEFTGAAVEQRRSKSRLIVHALLAGAGVLLLIQVAIGSWRHTLLTLVNLPFALVGGIAAVWLDGGIVSVGSMVGFVTLFGVTVRNAIMLISHYRRLVVDEKSEWNTATVIQGAKDRLPAVLMTATVTGLAMLPVAWGSDNPGREIMGPMAAIIIGGLISSTILTLLLLPTLLLRWGRFPAPGR